MRTRHLFLSAALLLLAVTPAQAGDLGSLNAVPADSVTVGVVRLAELRDSPLARRIFSHADEITLDGEAEHFLREAGFNPMKDIDRVTFSLSPDSDQAGDGDALLVLEGRFDVERLSNAIASRGMTRFQVEGGSYYRFTEEDSDTAKNGAVSLVNSSLALVGEEDAVARSLGTLANGGSDFANAAGLAHLLSRVDTTSSAWLLVDVPRSTRLKGQAEIPGRHDRALDAALKNVSVVGVWADDNGTEVKLGATAESNDAETLTLLEDLLRGMLATWRLAAQEKAPEMVSEIRRFQVTRSGESITLSGAISADILEKFAARGRHSAAR